MKTMQYIRNSLLTGVCVGLLTGCSWLEDWPPKDSEMARKSAPKPPESKIEKVAGGTWLNDNASNDAMAQEQNAQLAMSDSNTTPKGIAIDSSQMDRIKKLESNVDQLSNDLKMIMPALTKLAAAQTSPQKQAAAIEPAAGADMAMPQSGQQEPTPLAGGNTANPKPGTVAWYEQQESRRRKNKPAVQPVSAPAPAPTQVQQQAYAPPAAPYQPPVQQAQYQQQPMYQQQTGYAQPVQQAYQQQPYQQQPPAYQPAMQQNYQPPVQPQASKPMPAEYQEFAPAPSPSYSQASYGGSASSSVTNVRFGEHSDKTRVVLDTSNNVTYSYDLDNRERILMINLPGVSWQGAQQMQVYNSPVVSSYNVMPDGQGGHQVIMQLKVPAQVMWSQALAPGGSQGHRVVFDIAPR